MQRSRKNTDGKANKKSRFAGGFSKGTGYDRIFAILASITMNGIHYAQ